MPFLARPAVWETALTTLFQDSSLARLTQAHFSQGFARHPNVCWKRDYVYQACLETLEEVRRQGPVWIGHDSQGTPQSGRESGEQS